MCPSFERQIDLLSVKRDSGTIWPAARRVLGGIRGPDKSRAAAQLLTNRMFTVAAPKKTNFDQDETFCLGFLLTSINFPEMLPSFSWVFYGPVCLISWSFLAFFFRYVG